MLDSISQPHCAQPGWTLRKFAGFSKAVCTLKGNRQDFNCKLMLMNLLGIRAFLELYGQVLAGENEKFKIFDKCVIIAVITFI